MRASLIRKGTQVLGGLRAPWHQTAEAEAVRKFNLSPGLCSRLVVQEQVQHSAADGSPFWPRDAQ
jgi:hypothetical protein